MSGWQRDDPKRAEKARNLRYKRPAVKSMAYFVIENDLVEMSEVCDEVTYSMADDWETIGNVIGDEDEAWEFRMMFPDLSADIERFYEGLAELNRRYNDEYGIEYDDCTVALLGYSLKYRRDYSESLWGFDTEELDYYDLTAYESDAATTEAGKRLMRLTKVQMLEAISRAIRVMVGYWNLRERYERLEAAMDIIRDRNRAQLELVKEINEIYEDAAKEDFRSSMPATIHLDELIRKLPQRVFVE